MDASRTIGWLTSHYPVTLPVAATASDTLCGRHAARRAATRGLASGARALRRCGDACGAGRRVPRVTFNYLGQFDAPRDATLVPRFGGTGVERDPQGPLGNTLAIHAYLDTDRDGARTLKVHWLYGAPQFERATIDDLPNASRRRCASRRRVRVRVAHRGGGATPGDFARAGRRSHAGRDRAHAARLAHDRRRSSVVADAGHPVPCAVRPRSRQLREPARRDRGSTDADRFTAAFDASIARHDILRTSVMDEAAPLQCVHRHAQMPVEQPRLAHPRRHVRCRFRRMACRRSRTRLRLARAAADAAHADPRDRRRPTRRVDASPRAARRLEHRAPARRCAARLS